MFSWLLEGKFKQWLYELLSKQKTFAALPFHGHQIVAAFIMFTFASWFSYYLLAPVLIHYSQRKRVKDEEMARLKWGHMIVSFLHAIMASFWSLYLWYDNALAGSVETRVLGYSPDFGYLFSFSMGYFLWDVFCCLWNLKYYGKGFLIHSIMGLTGLTCCYGPFMMYPISRFLLFEISTIFLDIHWFLEKLGYGGGMMMLVNDAIALLAYLSVRLIFGSYLTFKFVRDLYLMWSQVPLLFAVISLAGNCTTHVLNFYWFYKLGRSAMRAIEKRQETKKHIVTEDVQHVKRSTLRERTSIARSPMKSTSQSRKKVDNAFNRDS